MVSPAREKASSITHYNIPESWKETLKAIQKIAPEAVLAGGALRDLDNGRPVKDLDIFVRGKRSEELYGLREDLIEAGIDCAEIDPEKMYPVGDGNDVVGFFETVPDLRLDGTLTQIIMIDNPCDPATLMSRFDYGICRIAFDGRCIHFNIEYHDDRDAEVFRLRMDCEDPRRLAQVVHRYARLVQKYPGWRWAPYSDPNELDL